MIVPSDSAGQERRVLIRRDGGSGAWIVYLRPEGPAGSYLAELVPGVTVHVDRLFPDTPILTTLFAARSGRIDEPGLHLVELLYGTACRDALAALPEEISVPYLPVAGGPHDALVHLLRLTPDIQAENPLVAAAASILAVGVGMIDGYARLLATRAACLLRYLPDVLGIDQTDDEHQMLRTVVNACRWLLGEQQDLNTMGALANDDAMWALDISDFDWIVPARADWDRSFRGDLVFRSRDASRSASDTMSDVRKDLVAGCALDILDTTRDPDTERAVSLAVKVNFERQPPEGYWLQVIESESACSFETRILARHFDGDSWTWESEVFLADGSWRPTLRVAAEPWTQPPPPKEMHARSAPSWGEKAGRLITQLRSQPTGDWRPAAQALLQCADDWAEAGDSQREALALSMAATAYDRAGAGEWALTIRRRLADCNDGLRFTWLDERWLDLADPLDVPALGIVKVLEPMIHRAVTTALAERFPAPENLDELIESCLRYAATLPPGPQAATARIEAILPVAVLCACLGRPRPARALLDLWCGEDAAMAPELLCRLEDLRSMLTPLDL